MLKFPSLNRGLHLKVKIMWNQVKIDRTIWLMWNSKLKSRTCKNVIKFACLIIELFKTNKANTVCFIIRLAFILVRHFFFSYLICKWKPQIGSTHWIEANHHPFWLSVLRMYTLRNEWFLNQKQINKYQNQWVNKWENE